MDETSGAAVLALFCSFGMWMTHYSLEAKPYAADAFWALLLPALAVWATESERDRTTVSLRRSLVWWVTGTLGLWLSLPGHLRRARLRRAAVCRRVAARWPAPRLPSRPAGVCVAGIVCRALLPRLEACARQQFPRRVLGVRNAARRFHAPPAW